MKKCVCVRGGGGGGGETRTTPVAIAKFLVLTGNFRKKLLARSQMHQRQSRSGQSLTVARGTEYIK